MGRHQALGTASFRPSRLRAGRSSADTASASARLPDSSTCVARSASTGRTTRPGSIKCSAKSKKKSRNFVWRCAPGQNPNRNRARSPPARQEQIIAEFGDVLFSLVNLSRFIKVNPEDALRQGPTDSLTGFILSKPGQTRRAVPSATFHLQKWINCGTRPSDKIHSPPRTNIVMTDEPPLTKKASVREFTPSSSSSAFCLDSGFSWPSSCPVQKINKSPERKGQPDR